MVSGEGGGRAMAGRPTEGERGKVQFQLSLSSSCLLNLFVCDVETMLQKTVTTTATVACNAMRVASKNVIYAVI